MLCSDLQFVFDESNHSSVPISHIREYIDVEAQVRKARQAGEAIDYLTFVSDAHFHMEEFTIANDDSGKILYTSVES